jgi:endoglucanase
MDFDLPAKEGVERPQDLELQVIHHQLLLAGNDYTRAARQEARRAVRAELQAVAAARLDPWSRWKREQALLEPAFRKAYAQFEPLDDASFFRLESKDDPNYAAGKPPTRVTRYATTRGNFREHHSVHGRDVTAGNLLANYSYLFLPDPLRPGCRYLLVQRDGRKVSFLFDEDRTISRAIKVNQSGYSPLARRKVAYLGAWQAGVGPVSFEAWKDKTFDVVDAETRRRVFAGTVRRAARNDAAATGEDLYELDLSGLDARGEFYLRLPGVGRSWPFYHHAEGVGRAFFIHLRGLFHQRAGHALEPAYTGWPRPLAHASAFACDYAVDSPYNENAVPTHPFAAIRAHVKANPDREWGPPGRGGVGGWYDAADYDRRWWHYDVVYDLLLAYEIAPENFTDGQAHTYESRNGIPDLLDEAAWGLLVWRNSQNERGGVSGHCEQVQHPDGFSWKPNGRPPHDPNRMYFSAATREASLRYAAAAAHLSRLLAPFDAPGAKGWLESALRAYGFGSDPAHHYRRDNYAGTGKPFSESEELILISACLAGLELYKATGRKDYLRRAVELYPRMKPFLTWPVKTVREDFWWAFYDDPAIPEPIRARAREDSLRGAQEPLAAVEQNVYRNPTDPRRLGWGGSVGTPQLRRIMMAYALTRDPKYLDAAALCMDWIQGCNPLGLSWTSGIGYVYPWCFMHWESEEDGVLDPVPGITLYGVTGGIPRGALSNGLHLGRFEGARFVVDKKLNPDAAAPDRIPLWRRFFMDYHDYPPMQEFTVGETISPCVLACGVLMGKGWKPSERLKAMRPREEKHLFGLWPTP